MKDISNLETDITRFLGKFTDRLVEVQREAANNIMNDAKLLAPGNRPYRDSIKVSETRITENSIETDITNNIMNDAKLLAPGNGPYRDSIKVSETRITENSIETDITTNVTVSSLDGAKYNLGYLLENGTDPHEIVPKNSDVLVFEKDGRTIFTKHVNHPGTKPQPHFIPALEKNKFKYKKDIFTSIFKR